MTVVLVCRPIALMSSSGIGGVQVTSFVSTTCPLRTDFGFVGRVARWTSLVLSRTTVPARPTIRLGWRTSPRPLAMTQPAASTRLLVELGSRHLGEVVLRTVIGQRQHHARQGDPIGDRMVDAEQRGRARPVPGDEVDLPQGVRRIQGDAGLAADVGLQRRLVARLVERHVPVVPVGIEVLVVDPLGATQGDPRGSGMLAEPREPVDHPLADDGPEHVEVRGFRGPDHRVDDQQVARGVHAQPCAVHRRHVMCAHGRPR